MDYCHFGYYITEFLTPKKKKTLACPEPFGKANSGGTNSLALSEEHELMEMDAVAMPRLAMKLWPGKVWWVQLLGRVKEYELN